MWRYSLGISVSCIEFQQIFNPEILNLSAISLCRNRKWWPQPSCLEFNFTFRTSISCIEIVIGIAGYSGILPSSGIGSSVRKGIRGIPWLGKSTGPFSITHGKLVSFIIGRQLFSDAYSQVLYTVDYWFRFC
ncbi:hypothetical protein BGW36DRAFT_380860 [Talaromyces proteolyticus]|uniref:Uncharacterized protein n=1 Tax=Talaromyces proteolyticus TaxID=1131652 RepID=A0AAD4KUN9_9EURO|nr:uncharacterized protein BGW36DRAFT_380860 [Talaromyces proteolyticus]KAH8696389.1 hypothetical protein BGW36DRAFT_380860 [Talaromyces proteolyticus]